MKMSKTLAAIIFAVALPCLAQAQTAPSLTFGQVLTPAQWKALFAGKQDFLGAPPVLTTGGTMTGPLVTQISSSAGAGLNLPPGTAPGSPANGDIWATSGGLFVQINGATVGPLTSAATPCAGCALTANPLSQFASTTSAQLRGILSDETGTGAAVFQNGALGTPISGTFGAGIVLGGVTMTLGSDATGDLYCRFGGVLTRIGIGGSATVLTSGGSGVCPTWVAATGGGNVSNTGTPVANQIAQWTNATTIQGVNLASLLAGSGLVSIAGTTSPTITVTAAAKSDEQAGTSATLATTPSQQQSHKSAVKAWATFTPATTPVVGDSFNVSSVTKSSVGTYVVNFTTPFTTANYACHTTTISTTSSGIGSNIVSQTASAVTAQAFSAAGSVTDPSTAYNIACEGTQ